MIVITDTNIFYSALAAPQGEIAKILKDRKKIQFLVPDYLLEEIEEHLPDLAKLTKKPEKQLKAEFETLLLNLTILSSLNINRTNFQKAKAITESIEVDDIPFIAFHLQYKHKIWSLDRKLIKGLTAKGYAHFFTSTAELREHLYKKQPTKTPPEKTIPKRKN
jgi:hypothetical protein